MKNLIKFTDTYCIGVTIEGTQGEVSITKQNLKSFKFEGTVNGLGRIENQKIKVSGVAKFWKTSKDGFKDLYKCGSAVLEIKK